MNKNEKNGPSWVYVGPGGISLFLWSKALANILFPRNQNRLWLFFIELPQIPDSSRTKTIHWLTTCCCARVWTCYSTMLVMLDAFSHSNFIHRSQIKSFGQNWQVQQDPRVFTEGRATSDCDRGHIFKVDMGSAMNARLGQMFLFVPIAYWRTLLLGMFSPLAVRSEIEIHAILLRRLMMLFIGMGHCLWDHPQNSTALWVWASLLPGKSEKCTMTVHTPKGYALS